MLTDIQIAQAAKMKPISKIAAQLGIREEELDHYGKYKAKLSESLWDRVKDRPDGKLILVTAVNPTPAGDWFSVAVSSDGSYGTPKGTMVSLPVRSDGKNWEVVQGLDINEFSKAKIEATCAELLEEQKLVKEIFAK